MAEALEQMILPAVNRHLVDGRRAEQVISQLMVSMVREGQVAVDCEWGANAAHEGASLLQLATRGLVVLVDLLALPTTPAVHKLLADVADLAFASRHVVVLGFDGEANDLPHLRARGAGAVFSGVAALLYDRPEVASAVERERELPGAAAPQAPRRGRGRRRRARRGRREQSRSPPPRPAASPPPPADGWGTPSSHAGGWGRASPDAGASTALRDAAALVGAYRERHAPVGDCWVVDQSLELGGDGLAAHASLRPAERYPCQGEALHEAMLRVLRNHTPAAIVVDELVDRAAAWRRRTATRAGAAPARRNATFGCVVELRPRSPGRPGEWSVVLDVNAAVDAIVENGAYDAQARFYDAAHDLSAEPRVLGGLE
ncbi:C2 domain-containing protein [Aureococcus anophagefferens]|nr:C2 domain-containing protein [Aureococcus anophagefferens]